jgi:hypothetical protein
MHRWLTAQGFAQARRLENRRLPFNPLQRETGNE